MGGKLFNFFSILFALMRAQIFLFPRINLGLVRVYGKVRLRGNRYNLKLGKRVVFLGDATLVCGLNSHGDRIDVGNQVVFEHGCYLNSHKGSIKIGDRSFIGVGTVIQGMGNVEIEEDVMLGPYVQIYSSDHGTAIGFGTYRSQPEIASPIKISNNVWIAANSILLRGTKLCANTIVAAGSVVKLETDMPALIAKEGQLATVKRVLGE